MEDGQKIGYRELIQTCHSAITRIFDFQIIEGERDCLKDPEKVILPESMALKMFGEQLAVGKAIHAEEAIQSKNNREYTVGAVYKDFPGNCQMHNLIYTAIGETYQWDNFDASNFTNFSTSLTPMRIRSINT